MSAQWRKRLSPDLNAAKISYLRDDWEDLFCTLAAIEVGTDVYVGIALCNNDADQFSRPIGRRLAEGRAMKAIATLQFGPEAVAVPTDVYIKLLKTARAGAAVIVVNWLMNWQQPGGHPSTDQLDTWISRVV